MIYSLLTAFMGFVIGFLYCVTLIKKIQKRDIENGFMIVDEEKYIIAHTIKERQNEI